MIQSYFFIPGNHKQLEEKIKTIEADFLIIDTEDSVNQSEIGSVFDRIIKLENKEQLFIRPRLFDGDYPMESTFKTLLKNGFRNFLIPKFRNVQELNRLQSIISGLSITNVKVILLIENPESLFSLKEILVNSNLDIIGIAFGSQDYCNETGMEHKAELLNYPRFMISGIAKAFKIISIDIACMDISNDSSFIKELQESESMGFESKFIIHPRQLKLLKNYKVYSEDEIIEAENILEEFESIGRPAVFVYKGKAIEPPHIQYYLKIQTWNKNYGSK